MYSQTNFSARYLVKTLFADAQEVYYEYQATSSEGVKRIALTCSVVLAVLPVFWMLGALIGNLGDLSDTEIVFCILIGVISSIVFFLIPRAIAKIAYWIIDGFSQDKN